MPALDIIRFFEAKAALVVAAVAALDSLPPELSRLSKALAGPDPGLLPVRVSTIEAVVRQAAVGPHNLLFFEAADAPEPFVLCAVCRHPAGSVEIKTIELDRDALAIAGSPRAGVPRPLEAMATAVRAVATDRNPRTIAAARIAIDDLSVQVRSAVSRLSLVKARLDLQQSFLASQTEEARPAPLTRLRADSHLDLSAARDMAVEARRLLSARSLTIGKGLTSPTAPAPRPAVPPALQARVADVP